MKIVEATLKDFEQIYDIEQACFVEPYTREQLMYEFSENPLNKILVAYDEDKIVGFVDYMITFNSATISQIAVLPNYRKKGLGSKLLEEMEKSFPKEIDDVVETITLEVRGSNINAISFYKKNGYENVVIKKHYYKNGENAVYMIKRLLCQ